MPRLNPGAKSETHESVLMLEVPKSDHHITLDNPSAFVEVVKSGWTSNNRRMTGETLWRHLSVYA
jgi:hypothetical protein